MCMQNSLLYNNHKSHTVQLKCNFNHAWRSTHGYTQIFACKIQKVAMEIFIFTRCGVARDVEHHETWNTTRREVPRDISCMYTAISPDGDCAYNHS